MSWLISSSTNFFFLSQLNPCPFLPKNTTSSGARTSPLCPLMRQSIRIEVRGRTLLSKGLNNNNNPTTTEGSDEREHRPRKAARLPGGMRRG